MTRSPGGPPPTGQVDAVSALYPFLAPPRPAGERLTDLVASTAAKAHEIVELRREIAERDGARIAACATAMAERLVAGARLLTFGNGGSGTDAQRLAHLFAAGEPHTPDADATAPGVTAPAVRWPAMGLTADPALLTALANDAGLDAVFARQIAALGRAGDIAVGLSTSGDSPNLGRAFSEAHRRGLLTVGFAGYDGGAMGRAGTVDHLFVVPSSSVHRIQEAQTTIYHVIWEIVTTIVPAASCGPPRDTPKSPATRRTRTPETIERSGACVWAFPVK